jgi:2-polyprenyl-3-methyl-5-hydroxy-6-metoxy-1,4-benzoquinol methylase
LSGVEPVGPRVDSPPWSALTPGGEGDAWEKHQHALRLKIRAERLVDGFVPFVTSNGMPPPEANLLEVSTTSHRRWLGSFIVAVKRILHRLLTPILLKQVDFNAALLRSLQGQGLKLSTGLEDLAVLKVTADSLGSAITDLKQSITVEQTSQSAQIGELRQSLAEMLKSREALRTDLESLKSREIDRDSGLRAIRQYLSELAKATESRESSRTNELEDLRRHLNDLTRASEDRELARATEIEAISRHLRELIMAFETTRGEMASLVARAQRLDEAYDRAARDLRRMRFSSRPLSEAPEKQKDAATERLAEFPPTVAPVELDYFGFESRFRGSTDAIESRQRDYLHYFRGKGEVLDIGCGRGEFLSLLLREGIPARGIDLDLDMVLLCQEKGLPVVQADAITYLASLPDRLLGGVFLAQVIEHLSTPQAASLLARVYEKLNVGGVFAVETLNPESLPVLTRWFWLDPTHVRLVHPETLKFLLESTGFRVLTCEFRQPISESEQIPRLDLPGVPAAELEAFNDAIARLNRALYGPLDYFVIGTR